MKYIFLSYPITRDLPVYGKRIQQNLEKIRSISKGDSANTYRFTIENHWGTHVDGPNHFFENGMKIADYQADHWFFNAPVVIRVELGSSEMLRVGRWMEEIALRNDCVILQSGWTKRRNEKSYTDENPGIHPEVAFALRRDFPKIRAIGIDWISVSPIRDRQTGRETHRAFLDPEGINDPVLIIEDMNLPPECGGLKRLIVLPLIMEGLDSAPCTVIGGLDD